MAEVWVGAGRLCLSAGPRHRAREGSIGPHGSFDICAGVLAVRHERLLGGALASVGAPNVGEG
jgi:hypothetical protein